MLKNTSFLHQAAYNPVPVMQEEGLDAEAALKAVQAATALTQPNHAFLAGGDVRMGDFILLVDSDTRVPEHCILPVVSELLRSPQVAFTQHYTTPLQARATLLCEPAVLHAASPAVFAMTHNELRHTMIC